MVVAGIGCGTGASNGIGPVLRIPEAPPRVVSDLPPPTPSEPEADPTEQVAPAATAEDTEPAEAPPVADQSGQSPGPNADATNADPSTDEEATDTRVRRELTSAPDQEVDRNTAVATLAAADALLSRVDRSALDSAGRAQYDTARRFLDQADSALAAGSVIFAHFLGQKAQTLAEGL